MNPTKNQTILNKNADAPQSNQQAEEERLQIIDDTLLDNCAGGMNGGICNGHQFCVYCDLPPVT